MKPLLRTALLLLLATVPFSTFTGAADTPASDTAALQLIEALGCRACHRIKDYGGSLASDLTDAGTRLTTTELEITLISHTTTDGGRFMPAYTTLTELEIQQISSYLYHLR